KVDNKIYFTMGNGTEEDMVELKGGGYYFYPYDEAEPHIFKSFEVTGPLFHDTIDRWGSFRSVFIPYISKDGTKFIIGADISTNYIDDLLKKKLITTFLISVLFMIFAIPLLAAFTSQTRKWAESLKTQTEKANAANAAKSEFMGKMSHELRTPLHGILAFSEIGINNSDVDKVKVYFTNISKSGERLQVLLDDLLDFSKLEAGKMEMSFKSNDVKNLIHDCIKEQTGLLNKYNLDISVIEETDSCYAECDAGRISQVILNLLNNAIKFSPENTMIKFIISSVVNSNDRTVKELQVSISDQGEGVPKDKRKTIFEKFTQVLNKNDKITGTGLGLTISSEIIQAHYGSIWCEESDSGGAKFVFRIPVLHPVKLKGAE
ncbi:HAMP domain-containing histidine kinase, partial [bacterium]|nr:HAMP domain-containing histidine kinase [bacterium]